MPIFQRPNYSETNLEEAVERIRQLEDCYGVSFETHPRYKLTNAEQMLLGIIVSRVGVATKESVYTLMYGMSDDPPEPKILDVFICKLRHKLAPHDIAIQTVWGRGWFMEAEDRAKAQALRFQPDEAAA